MTAASLILSGSRSDDSQLAGTKRAVYHNETAISFVPDIEKLSRDDEAQSKRLIAVRAKGPAESKPKLLQIE